MIPITSYEFAARTHQIAWPRVVAIGEPQVNDKIERFAPHRRDHRLGLDGCGVDRGSQLVHSAAGQVELLAARCEFLDREGALSLSIVVCPPLSE